MVEHPRSVLIPIANPELAPQYLHLGARIAKEQESEIILLYIVPSSSDQTSNASSGQAEQVLEEARLYAEPLDVPVKTMTYEARGVAEGIVFVAEDPHIDYLIMGWRGDIQGGKTVIGSEIDGVVRESDCHAVVMQQGAFRENEGILVPAANPNTAPLGLAIASLLRGDSGPKVTVLHLSPAPLSDMEKKSFQSALFALADETEKEPEALFTEADQFEIAFEMQDDPARELAERSKNYDRMIVGTSQGGYSETEVFGKLPLQIAKEATCPVIFVRPKGPH